MFQAHLILLIKERGFSNAARVAWDVTERLRKEGHEAYVASIDPPGPPAKRRRPRSVPQSTSRNDPGSP
jgi:thioesterase domain-containing protein